MTELKSRLFELRDDKYCSFNASLIPNLPPERFIGVRTPLLRKIAAEMARDKSSAKSFMNELPHKYHEENNIHAFLIALMCDNEDVFEELERFLPYIDNWATCDLLRPPFNGAENQLIEKIGQWITSEHEYTVRFGIEMLMVHFLDERFDPEFLLMAASVRREEYYIRMMIAWYFAEALVKQYECAVRIIEDRKLDKWTHNKAIQKARESFRIPSDRKDYLRSLRRGRSE
ncbi:MAG: DNA alkylation repair protein [Clostridia bacterium]|nr:DNA alkylation repair protein [Clostridia bacterium]